MYLQKLQIVLTYILLLTSGILAIWPFSSSKSDENFGKISQISTVENLSAFEENRQKQQPLSSLNRNIDDAFAGLHHIL
jgi:hypothetical protein